MPAAPTEDKARQYAYRILAARPLSEKEFRARLRGKGYGGDVVEAVTAQFQELGYLNDESVARQLARTCAVNKLWGNRRIEITLKEKGLARELIDSAIALVREEFTERAAVRQLLGKKSRGQKTAVADRLEKRRLLNSLMGKGFPPGLIFEMLAINEEEELHDGE